MKSIKSIALFALLAGAASFALVGCKTDGHDHSGHAHEAPAAADTSAKPYPLDKCVVSGEAFEHGKPYTFVHNGQQIKLCCKDCLADFNKDPEKYMAKINAAK
jgi:UDP-N-acetylmuramyl pentapeptide synthase